MEKAFLADRANLAIAEETGQADRAKSLLNFFGVVVRAAKEVLSATVAATQAAAVDGFPDQLVTSARKQSLHVFAGGGSGAALELDGLALARQGGHRDASRTRVGANEIADEEIAAVEFLKILIHH